MRRHAFSLVEIAIALPLALMVLVAATAAFRAASKTAAVSQQLSRENAAIVAGYEAATNEVDFWFCLDNPADPAGQQLRTGWQVRGLAGLTAPLQPAAPGTQGVAGQPFAPLELPADFWNPAVMDPRWWPRMGLQSQPTGAGGNEQQIAHLKHPHAAARWLPWVQDRCYWSIGLGGYLEYTIGSLPVNWLLPSNGENSFGNTVTLTAATHGPLPRQWWDGLRDSPTVRDSIDHRYSYQNRCVTYNRCSVWLAPRDGCTWNPDLGSGVEMRYDVTGAFVVNRAEADGDAGNDRIDQISGAALPDSQGALYAGPPEVRVAPAGFPEVRVGVARYSERNANSMSVIDIRVINPQAGTQRQIRFWSDGTSLRGARQQRMWAHWSSGAPPAMDAVRSATVSPVQP